MHEEGDKVHLLQSDSESLFPLARWQSSAHIINELDEYVLQSSTGQVKVILL